jgi:hypothetical protein
VNVSSAAGFLQNILGEDLKLKLATSDSTLTYDELNGLMKDFVASALDGTYTDKGWPTTYAGIVHGLLSQ